MAMRLMRKAIWTVLGVAMLFAAGCKSDSPGTPSDAPAATITISNNTVSPKNVTVPRGSQVAFVNNDSRRHTMNSDPHPTHTDCPEINTVGELNAGQSKQTANLTTARTCGYHDHDLETVTSLQGTITVQ
jgi:plastocyanin